MHGLRTIAAATIAALACPAALHAAHQAPDTLVIAVGGNFSYPIPGLSRPVEAQRIADLLFLRLGTFTGTSSGDKAAVPLLARSWKRIDPVTIRFELDPRARWHDGAPVTADDVIFSFERARDPKRAPQLAPLLAGISSVTRDGTGGVVVKFTQPYAEQLYDATYHVQILPRHLLERIPPDSLATSSFAKAPVGNGAYRWSRSIPGQLTELVAVPDFFLGRPEVDYVVWRMFNSHEARLNELLAGGVDVMEDLVPPFSNVARLSSRPDLRLAQFPSQGIAYVVFNQRDPRDSSAAHPVLSRRAVREALTIAVDQPTMIKAMLGKFGLPISAPTPSAAWYRTLAPAPFKFDPARARAILAADGWKDSDNDGILDRAGQPLRVGILVPSSSTLRLQIAQVLEQQWRAIGVDAEVQPVEGPVFGSSRAAGRFDTSIESYTLDPSPWGLLDLFGCGSVTNLAHYCNRAADSLLAAAHWSAGDPTRDLRQYFSTLVADHPAVFLYARDIATPLPRRYRSPDLHPESPFIMLWTWNRQGR